MKRNLEAVEVGEHEWFEEVTRSRAGWRALCQVGLEQCRETRTA